MHTTVGIQVTSFFFFENWYSHGWYQPYQYCWPCVYLTILGCSHLEFRGYEIVSETIFGPK